MALSVPPQSKIPTKNPQLGLAGTVPPAPSKARVPRSVARGSARVSGETREATRGDDRVVVEVAGGVTVYPARGGGPVAGGVVRRRPPPAVRVGDRGGTSRQAGEGHRAAGRGRAGDGTPGCGPDRVLTSR
jgi:hypothetical protein